VSRPSQPSLIPVPSPPARGLHTPAPLVKKPATNELALSHELMSRPAIIEPKPTVPSGRCSSTMTTSRISGLGAGWCSVWWCWRCSAARRFGYLKFFRTKPATAGDRTRDRDRNRARARARARPRNRRSPVPVPVPVPVPEAQETPAQGHPAGTVVSRESLFQRIFFLEKRGGRLERRAAAAAERRARAAAKAAAPTTSASRSRAQLDEIEGFSRRERLLNERLCLR